MITSWINDFMGGQRFRLEAPITAWRVGLTAVQKGARLDEALNLAVNTLFRGLR